ncbi:MAG: mevalonate kinase [Silvanigrellaceae bacterium]|nr:mevalonate kinase [Silvanigrellaceae bacterium]
MLLSEHKLITKSPGKTILIGEHAAVYGFPAIAMALPDICLHITLHKHSKTELFSHWDDSWHVIVQGKASELTAHLRALLTKAFAKALVECGAKAALKEHIPQKITIDSTIPLGGGLGGSAAISLSLLKLAQKVTKIKFNQIELNHSANTLDSLFHGGQASGLDTAAIISLGIIEFKKGDSPTLIKSKKNFWIALVDSGERAETAQMIARVADLLKSSPDKVWGHLSELGKLAHLAKESIEEGTLDFLGKLLSEAHEHLRAIAVSSLKLDSIVSTLKDHGALGAKLTGAGGGGLVLSIFKEHPHHIYELFDKQNVFISKM